MDARFCAACGASMTPACQACGATCAVGARYCAQCGTPLDISELSQSTLADARDDAERRQITVVFCDLVGSMQLSEQLDPEDLRTALQIYQKVAAQAVARYDGYIAQHLGDGLLIYFGFPRAHEDDPARAIHTSLEILSALQAPNLKTEVGPRVTLSARVGIHTGIVVVGAIGDGNQREQLALGDVPNLAARLQSVAAPDTVVVSERTAQLAGGDFTYVDLGAQHLKGVALPVRTWRVDGVGVASSRFEAATRG